jgi:hypothetical protein
MAMLAFGVLLRPSAAWAQSTANYAFSTSTTGSLVDMSSGTTNAFTANVYRDDDASTVQPIGFTFVFMGTAHTQFSVNSNGQLRLGATAISGGNATPSAGAPILAPIGGDNALQASGRVTYRVVPGTNRTLVVEWTGLRIPYVADPAAGTPTQVQAILEENTGRVEYRYGGVFNNGTSVTRSIFISAGSSAGQIGVVTTFTTTPTYDATVTSATTTALPDNAAVAGLNSAADGARRTFTFTPPTAAVTAPTVTLSNVLQTTLTVNILDNSTNEGSFSVFRSTDNVNFTLLGTVPTGSSSGTGSTVTLAQTGLVANTTYYYQATANAEILQSLSPTVSVTTPVPVPICGTKTVGPGADYASLTAGFADIVNNGLCGPLLLELQPGYVSTAETFPLVYSYGGGTATNTVTIRPATGATNLNITSTVAGAAFSFAGAKYVTIDGRPGGSASPVSGAALPTDLLIASTSTTGTPVQFSGDAAFNVVQHTRIAGVGTSTTTSPDVSFSSTLVTAGNSDNTIQYNNISSGATTPSTLVYSGSSLNSRNSIIGNNLSNFYGTGAAYGMYLNNAGSGWVITGNSLYQTASRAAVSTTSYGINLNGGNGHTVTGNFIGGTTPNAGGTPLTVTGSTVAYRFVGILVATATGAATSVQGNTVANISWLSSSGASTANGIVSGIYVSSGDANIGTTTGNTIGTAAGPITVSSSTGGGYSFGISTNSSGTVSVARNTISNITTSGTTAATASSVAGILVSAGATVNISQNKIYGLTASSGGASLSNGILVTGGTTNNFSNNLIGELTAPASTSLVAVSGLQFTSGTNTVAFNTINFNATSTGATFGTSGIYLNSTSATLDLRNNIVVNKSTAAGTGGYTAALRRLSGTAGTAPANLAAATNNNIYYAGVPSATNLIYVEGTTTATNASQTLAAYKILVSTRESVSQTEDTPFASTSGASAAFLHINPAVATLAESKGTPIGGLTIDFDGDPRDATRPDIGADEGSFISAGSAVDIAAGVLVAPSTTGCYGAAENVTVSIRNNGTQALDFAANPVTVTVNVTGATTQTLTATFSTGTLAVGASQNVTVGTLNMTAAGTYTFAIMATAQGDGDTSNDTGSGTRTKEALAVLPQLLNFTGFTGGNLTTLFPGWSEATGATAPTGTTSTWVNDDYANVVGPNGVSAKINLDAAAETGWIISPRIAVVPSTRLSFDLALTTFAATTADVLDPDDLFEVRVSTDCGLTFTPLRTFNASTTISSTGQTETINLGATYAGQEVIIGFFATEGATVTGDIDLFLDNVNITTPLPIDLAPTALVSPASGQGCYSPAETVTVAVRNLGTSALDFSANPATVTVGVTGAATQTLTTTLSTGTLAAGATQNLALPGTLDMSAAGTYTFGITATVQGDQTTTNDVLTPAPTRTVAAPVAGSLLPATASLCVSGTLSLNLIGSANGSIQYQSSPDNVTFTDVAGATSAAYTTPVLTATTYFRARITCNATVVTSNVATVTVNNPQVTATNSPVAVCEGSTATLTANAATGTTLRLFEAATGGTALATTATGTGISYTTPALTASRQYFVEALVGTTETAGKPTSPGTDGGFNSGNSGLAFTATAAVTIQSVTVFPSSTTAGSMSVELRSGTGTVLATAGPFAVPAGSSTVRTPLVLPINLSVPGTGSYRLVTAGTPAPPELYREFTNTYPYTSPSGTISVTGGILTGSASSTYYFFYNWQVSNECTGTRTPIQVNVAPTPTATLPATAASCGTSAVALTGAVGGSATGGTYTTSGTGTFSPDANTLTATYTPSAADLTAGTVTLTLTTTGQGACAAATATQTLTFSAPATAGFSYPAAGSNCAGTVGTVAATLAAGATAGTFSSTAGLTIDPATGAIDLATSAAGTYTVTNTVAATGTCPAATATATVTIAPATSAAFSYGSGTFCLTGTNPTATVTGTAGGTFSSTAGLTLNATTGAITLSSSTAGTYTVTYSVAGPCPTSNTQAVTITTAPVASFSYGSTPTFCVSGTTSPVPVFGTGASGGAFSSTAGLTLNATTGAITLSTSTPGTYTVTNTIAASSGCAAAAATATVTITAAPVATFSYATTAGCVGSTSVVTPTLGTGATAGAFTSTTGLTINATTGTIDLATSAAGTYTVTNTVAATGGCAAATATATFTVNPRPATPTVTVTYNGIATTLTSSATTGNQFFLNGVAIAGATGQTYVANGTPAQLGTYTVVVTNAAGCASLPSTPLVVTGTKNGIAGASLKLYPNPTPTGRLKLELTGYRSATQLTVLDALGRVVLSELLPAAAGTATHSLDLTGVASGVYLLCLSNVDGMKTRRLVRE